MLYIKENMELIGCFDRNTGRKSLVLETEVIIDVL